MKLPGKLLVLNSINEYFMGKIDSSDKKLLNSTEGFHMTSTDSARHPTYCLFLNNEKHLSIVS